MRHSLSLVVQDLQTPPWAVFPMHIKTEFARKKKSCRICGDRRCLTAFAGVMLPGAASLHWTLLGQLQWMLSDGDAVVGLGLCQT